MSDSTTPPADNQPPSQPPASRAPDSPPPGKRRHWGRSILIAVGVIIVLLVILVLLAPTLLSTGPVRRLVVAQVNDRLNGKVSIADWSLGWSGPLTIGGVKVYDASGQEILSLDSASTQLGLWRAVTGTLDLGKTSIDGLNLTDCRIDKDGTVNYQSLLKTSSRSAPSASTARSTGPAKLPQVRGTIAITNLRGKITAEGVAEPLYIDPSRITISIPDINQPVTNSVELAYHIGTSPTGKIMLDGSVSAITNGRVDMQKVSADETLKITNAALDAFSPLLRMFNVDLNTTGVANGQLKLTAAGVNHLAAEGDIKIADLKVSGPLLKGDSYSTKIVNIPLSVSVASVEAQSAVVEIKSLGVEFDQGKVSVSGSAPMDTLASAAPLFAGAVDQATTGKTPQSIHWQGGKGQLAISVDVPDIASIANQLPHLIKLQKGTTLAAGQLHHQTTLVLSAGSAAVSTTTDLQNVTGSSDGRAITLPPVHLSASMTADPAPSPNLRDLKLALTSGFASINGSGPTLGQMQLNGDFDLHKLQSQAEQFVDLQAMLKVDQPIQIAGAGTFQLATQLSGADRSNASAKGDIKISNLRVGGGLLHGDTYSTQSLIVPVDISVASAGTPTAAVDIKSLGLEVDQGKVALSGHAPMAALSGLGELIPAALSQKGTAQWQGGQGEITLTADVPDLAALANQLPHVLQLRPGMTLSSGKLHHQTVLAMQTDKAVITTRTELSNVAGRDNGKAVSLAPIDLSADAAITSEPSPALHDIKLNITSGFASIKGGGPSLGDLAMAGQFDLHDLQTQVDQFINLATLLKASGPVELAGKGDFQLSAQGEATKPDAPLAVKATVTLNDLKVAGLTAAAPIVQSRLLVNTSATVDRAGANVQGLRGVAFTLQSGPAAQPLVHVAAVADDVRLQPALAIPLVKLTSLQIPNLPEAQKQFAAFIPPDVAVLAGSLSAGAQVSYVNQQLRLVQPLSVNLSHLTVDQIQKDGSRRRLLSDQPVVLNVLADQPDPNSVHLSELTAQVGDAITASVAGTVSDLSTQRRLDGVRIVLDYDLAKLWPIVRPVALTPEQQQEYAQMAMSGQFKKTINVSGAYPAGLPFNQAISHLHADGGVALASFTIPEKGITLANADIPFTLDGGVLVTGAPSAAAPSAQPTASALLNTGSVRLDQLRINLTTPHPTLTTPDNYQLLQNVALNSVFAKSVLSRFLNNPLFADAKQADGQMSATLLQCRDLPLDGSIMEPTAGGNLSLKYSITGLQIGNDLITSLVKYLAPNAFNQNSLQGAIKDGTIELSHGVVTHNTPVSVDQYVIGLSGSVAMATARFTTPMNMSIPTALFRQKELAAALPELTIPLTGTATSPQIDLGKAIQDNLGKGLLNQIFKQPAREQQGNPNTGQQQQQQQQNNPLDELFKGLGKKKHK